MIRKRVLMGVFAGLVVCAAVAATERIPNLYRTHKISIGDVAVECTSGRKPSVRQLEGPPVVIVSCPVGRNQE